MIVLAGIDCARWPLYCFSLACHCDDIDAVMCVHGFNCAHLPATPQPSLPSSHPPILPPVLVQHQAKARAEPGGV